MRPFARQRPRRGSILPIVAVLLPMLCFLTALALDLGVLAVSRTNCQSAADSAALVATRTLDNKTAGNNSNQTAATAAANLIVSQSNLATRPGFPNTTTVEYGLYKYYDSANPPPPPPAGAPPYANPGFNVVTWYPAGTALPAGEKSWTAAKVSITAKQASYFSTVMGVTNLDSYAYAVAVYRPRDIAMTLDMTGSMKFGCMVSANGAYLSCDPSYPQAGHFARYTAYTANNPNTGSGASSPSGRHNPFFTTNNYDSSGESWAPTNFTVKCAGGPPAVQDFYYDPGNVATPSNTLVTPNPASLVKAFHHWQDRDNPANVLNPGNPDAYVAETYDYSGWGAATSPLTPGTYSVYPTPDTFADQTSTTAAMGDRYPRKRGAERLSTPGAWDAAAADGAAYTLAEYLGWTNRYSGGAVPTATSNTAGFRPPTATPSYNTDWSDFRDATWEANGYDLDVSAYSALGAARTPRTAMASPPLLPAASRFKGYTMGPGYWGKSFFMWPPDPRSDKDWRVKFFYNRDAVANAAINANQLSPSADNDLTVAGTNGINQAILRNGTGETTSLPGANQVNYRAILAWIKQPPMCLPPNLRAGRVMYYTSIPDDVDSSAGDANQKRDKAFWKYYIDYVLRSQNVTSYESKGWPEGATPTIYQSAMLRYSTDPTFPYMNYMDNPSRPRSNFWFGPITMISMLNERGAWAGTVHESQTWQLKAGMNSVLDDIRKNHPNDNVGLSYFCTNRYGYFSVGCSQDFDLMKYSLFYPKSLVENGQAWTDPTKEVAAFNTSSTINWQQGGQVQNAQSGTDPNTGLATCFNILAPTTTTTPTQPNLPPAPNGTASASRRGRRGASKVVIFETDGVPNAASTANLQTLGFNSYYDINVGSTASYGNAGWATAATPALAIIDQMLKPLATANSGDSGLSSPSSPAKVYAIGFGDLFNVVPQPTTAVNARTFLLQVQQRGGTSNAGDAALPPYQIITGPYQERIDKLKTAFERILQSGVQVTLVE